MNPIRHFAINANLQRGASLLIALIALIIISLAAMTLIRSVDTATLVAGNYAFKSGTQNISDIAVEESRAYLDSIVTTAAAANANLPAGCAAAASSGALGTCRYYARKQADDADGLPFVNWSSANIPSFDYDANTTAVEPTSAPSGSSSTYPTFPTGYQIQFVVERLCDPNTAVTVNTATRTRYDTSASLCKTGPKTLPSTNKAGGTQVSEIVTIHYRVTARVSGPKNAVTFTQTVLSR